jgi:hypothetical protein
MAPRPLQPRLTLTVAPTERGGNSERQTSAEPRRSAVADIWTDTEANVLAADSGHAGEIVTKVVNRDRPSAVVDILRVKRTPSGRYSVTYKVTWQRSSVHTIGGQPISDTNPGAYGRNHDMACPGCEGTSFTASPRSDAYWSS